MFYPSAQLRSLWCGFSLRHTKMPLAKIYREDGGLGIYLMEASHMVQRRNSWRVNLTLWSRQVRWGIISRPMWFSYNTIKWFHGPDDVSLWLWSPDANVTTLHLDLPGNSQFWIISKEKRGSENELERHKTNSNHLLERKQSSFSVRESPDHEMTSIVAGWTLISGSIGISRCAAAYGSWQWSCAWETLSWGMAQFRVASFMLHKSHKSGGCLQPHCTLFWSDTIPSIWCSEELINTVVTQFHLVSVAAEGLVESSSAGSSITEAQHWLWHHQLVVSSQCLSNRNSTNRLKKRGFSNVNQSGDDLDSLSRYLLSSVLSNHMQSKQNLTERKDSVDGISSRDISWMFTSTSRLLHPPWWFNKALQGKKPDGGTHTLTNTPAYLHAHTHTHAPMRTAVWRYAYSRLSPLHIPSQWGLFSLQLSP